MDKRELFKVVPADLDAMRKLMQELGDSEGMFWGTDECGNRVSFSISHDRITTSTYQDNDWVRINTYHWDGTREESYSK